MNVSRFSLLTVDGGSFVFDTACSVDKLGEVSKCHNKGKKNSVNNNNIDGGLVKGLMGRDSDCEPHISAKEHSEVHETGRNEVPPFVITSTDINCNSSTTKEIANCHCSKE